MRFCYYTVVFSDVWGTSGASVKHKKTTQKIYQNSKLTQLLIKSHTLSKSFAKDTETF